MATALENMLNDDMAFAVSELPDSFVWPAQKGKTFACVANDSSDGHMQIDYGVVLTPGVPIVVQTSLFTDDGHVPTRAEYLAMVNTGKMIKTHDEVIYDGKTLHVEQTARSVDGVTVAFTLASYMAKG
jgi:hypothetical protein